MLRPRFLITALVTLVVLASASLPSIDLPFRSNACKGVVVPDDPRRSLEALGPLDDVTRAELCHEWGVPDSIPVRDGHATWRYDSRTFSVDG